MSYYAILRALEDVEYRVILQAWGILREKDLLSRDPEGNYLLRVSTPNGTISERIFEFTS